MSAKSRIYLPKDEIFAILFYFKANKPVSLLLTGAYKISKESKGEKCQKYLKYLKNDQKLVKRQASRIYLPLYLIGLNRLNKDQEGSKWQ